jgi:hypothetical protein
MHDVEQMMRQRVRELEKQHVPYVAFCHNDSIKECRGMVIYPLIPQNCLMYDKDPRGCYEQNNPMGNGSLRRLQSAIAKLYRQRPFRPEIVILSNLDPLTPEDREKVNRYVPVLHNADTAM